MGQKRTQSCSLTGEPMGPLRKKEEVYFSSICDNKP